MFCLSYPPHPAQYADGSKEEITDKRLPTAVAAMLYSRGHQQHCCIVSGRQDVKRRPKLFDLANVAAANPHLWLQFPAVCVYTPLPPLVT